MQGLKNNSKLKWLVSAVILGVLLLLVFGPTIYWRKSVSESCHLCGNRRITISTGGWFRKVRKETLPVIGAQFPIPDGHRHQWWRYGSTISRWPAGVNSAGGRELYKDGSSWPPAQKKTAQ